MKSLILIIFIGSWLIGCEKEAISNNRLVMASDALEVRESAKQDGKILFFIPNYTLVELLEEIGETIEIKDKKGKWTRIKIGSRIGYVFGGNLLKVKILNSQKNSDGSLFFNFYSILDLNIENPECIEYRSSYGCIAVVHISTNDKIVNSFRNKIVTRWIDKDHIEEIWSKEYEHYDAYGFSALDIHTKSETEILRREYRVTVENNSDDDRLCFKNTCFTVYPPYIYQPEIKSHPIFKYYEREEYNEKIDSYNIEISMGENVCIVYIPSKNIIIQKLCGFF